MSAARASAAKTAKDEALLNAAERLFAIHGLEAVSLRQIASAAGAANNFAVQYHFRDKEGLVQAIYMRRLQSVETRRAGLLAQATRSGRLSDPRALAEILMRPTVEEKDEVGHRSYAGFLLGMQHFYGEFIPPRVTGPPLADHVQDLLALAVPEVPRRLLTMRIASVATMFLTAFVNADRRPDAATSLSEEQLLCDQLNMATAALTAPASAEIHEVLRNSS